MEIKKIVNGKLDNNSYIIYQNSSCIVIDPTTDVVAKIASESGLKILAVLLTHGHFDHFGGVDAFKKLNVPIYVHNLDDGKCCGKNMQDRLINNKIIPFNADVLLTGGEILEFDGLKITVIHTPGHSGGSVCYLVDNFIFCGDTLFKDGYGRYDFYDGSLTKLKESIKTLFELNGEYTLYCGHGEDSSLNYERQGNPILW